MQRQLDLSPLPERFKDHCAVFVPSTGQEIFISMDYSFCQEVADTWNVEVGYWIGQEALAVHVEEIYPAFMVAGFTLPSVA